MITSSASEVRVFKKVDHWAAVGTKTLLAKKEDKSNNKNCFNLTESSQENKIL